MFLPPKRHKIALASWIAAVLICVQTSDAQNAEFNRRMAAIQQARARAQQPAVQPTEVTTAPPAAQPVRQASAQVNVQPNQRAQSPVRQAGYVPRHMRTAQVSGGPIIDSGAPIMAGETIVGAPMDSGIVTQGTMMGSSVVPGTIVGGPIEGDYIDGGCASGDCGGCSSCGQVGESYFDDCCDRGGCPPGTPCWLDGLGTVFRNAEFYSGFTSFRSTLFQDPTSTTGALVNDCAHGYYGGVNVGIPLCRLSCGVFSGQFGVRTVNTDFNGSQFTQDERNQLFFTAGFYRRVDYGLQLGVVADVLREEWFANSDLVQIRGDIGYVWPAGTTFGFRFANNVQDDVVSGTFNGTAFTNMIVTTSDNYRFYLRHDAARGGFGEIFAGWTQNSQGMIGLDFDLPITNRVAFEAGFTYFLDDNGVPANSGFLGGNQGQAYNSFVGISFRPRGRSLYRSYDRPLFDVADNGSMLTIR